MSSSLAAAKPTMGEPLSRSNVLDVDSTAHIITTSLDDTLRIMGRPLSHSGVGDVTYPTSSRGVAPIKGRLTSYSDGRYTADNGLYDSDDVRMSSTFPVCAEGNDCEDPTCFDVKASFIPSTQRRPTYAVESTDSKPTTQRYSDDTDQHMVDPVSPKLLSGRRPVVGRLSTTSGRHTPDIRFIGAQRASSRGDGRLSADGNDGERSIRSSSKHNRCFDDAIQPDDYGDELRDSRRTVTHSTTTAKEVQHVAKGDDRSDTPQPFRRMGVR